MLKIAENVFLAKVVVGYSRNVVLYLFNKGKLTGP